jgi:phosphoribosylamine---glycine ligase
VKVLFIDPFGDALDLVMRASKADHDCIHFIGTNPDKYRFIGRGLVHVVRDFKPWLRWADLVILCDNVLHLTVIDAFRADNPGVVFGPTKAVAEWETDRLKGMQVFEDHGIPVPEFKLCSSYEQAVSYVRKRGARLVCKPCGDADKSLSYTSKSPEDLLFMLGKWDKQGKLNNKFIIQDFIPGIEFAVGAYCGSDGFGGGFEENFEHKKLFPGEIGPATGEMGTVLQFKKKSRLADRVLKPLEKTLMNMRFTGDIDVNCIIDDHGVPWPLEFTSRMGYPALQIQTPLFPDDPVSWMYNMITGRDEPTFRQDVVSVGVSLCLHPFPYPSYPLEQVLDYPIYGVTERNRNNLHPYMCQKGTETEWMTAGDYVLVVTDTSLSHVSQAARRVYKTIDDICVPGSLLYRYDIGEKLKSSIPELQKHGYATSFTY